MIYLDNAATTKMTEGSLRVLKEANRGEMVQRIRAL